MYLTPYYSVKYLQGQAQQIEVGRSEHRPFFGEQQSAVTAETPERLNVGGIFLDLNKK